MGITLEDTMADIGTTPTEATTAVTGTAAITTVTITTADIILTTRPSLAVSRFQSLFLYRSRSKRSTFGVQEFGVQQRSVS
jgi:hypothetical protein